MFHPASLDTSNDTKMVCYDSMGKSEIHIKAQAHTVIGIGQQKFSTSFNSMTFPIY